MLVSFSQFLTHVDFIAEENQSNITLVLFPTPTPRVEQEAAEREGSC
jgi:hypothetical protein